MEAWCGGKIRTAADGRKWNVSVLSVLGKACGVYEVCGSERKNWEEWEKSVRNCNLGMMCKNICI